MRTDDMGGARAIADLRTRLFEHLQSLSLAFLIHREPAI
jgi:hypothetical protein